MISLIHPAPPQTFTPIAPDPPTENQEELPAFDLAIQEMENQTPRLVQTLRAQIEQQANKAPIP